MNSQAAAFGFKTSEVGDTIVTAKVTRVESEMISGLPYARKFACGVSVSDGGINPNLGTDLINRDIYLINENSSRVNFHKYVFYGLYNFDAIGVLKFNFVAATDFDQNTVAAETSGSNALKAGTQYFKISVPLKSFEYEASITYRGVIHVAQGNLDNFPSIQLEIMNAVNQLKI